MTEPSAGGLNAEPNVLHVPDTFLYNWQVFDPP